jgi:hypothetical protein
LIPANKDCDFRTGTDYGGQDKYSFALSTNRNWKASMTTGTKYFRILENRCAKNLVIQSFSLFDEESNGSAMSISQIIFSVDKNPFKLINPINEEALNVLKCLIFPDRDHGLRRFETTSLSSCILTFQRVRSHADSDLVNKMSEEEVRAFALRSLR